MKKVKRINRKVFNIILICIFGIILGHRMISDIPAGVVKANQTTNDGKTENLFTLDEISQSFKANDDYLSSIKITISTELTNNSSAMDFILKDENGDTVIDKEVDTSEFKNDRVYSFDFEPQKDSKDKKYTACFIPKDVTDGDKAYFYLSKADVYNDGSLSVNDKDTKSDLVFSTTYHKGKVLNIRDSLKRVPVNGKIFVGISFVLFVILITFLYRTLDNFDK